MKPLDLSVVSSLALRAAGLCWTLIWSVTLYLVVSPWRDLGGLVSERLRWLEWYVLVVGLLVGLTIGGWAREAARPGSGRTHARLLRVLLCPMLAITAAFLVGLWWTGHADPIGVVLTGFLAYWAGLDLAFGALPLLRGRCYRFNGPIEPDPEPELEFELDHDSPWGQR